MALLAVFTTVSDDAQASALARGAIEQRLAACVQQEAIRSTYRWQGAIESGAEVRLLFKTTRERVDALIGWLATNHPYELPAIYALPVAAGTPAYAAWVTESVMPQAHKRASAPVPHRP
jgi:periplasmic divalent cation tolerance protein